MRKPLFLAAAFVALAFLPNSLRAGVVLSENFDELTQMLTATSVGAFSAINGTNVDIVGPAYALCNGPESGNCIDMLGTGGNSQGQLQSNMTFAAGTYTLSFDLIGSQRGPSSSVTVTLGNYDQTFTLASGDLTSGIVINAPVTVTTPGQLLFVSNVAGNQGLLLDNVSVSTATVATPEPSSLLFAGLAAIAFAGMRKRK